MPVSTLSEWVTHYRQQPQQLVAAYQQLDADLSRDDNAWIYIASHDEIYAQLTTIFQAINSGEKQASDFALLGVPFAAKDNIDVAGMPTSAGCPAFTYQPGKDATVIARLKAAGAIVVGKTNLDQFATGLVGTRSPFGAVENTFNPEYVSGGSSSGSASVVARGLVCFSLGTDTAGSGRVPAGFNNIVGLKPTKGWVSTMGVVPACRLNDCVSVFALTVEDAETVVAVAGGYDPQDPYSRTNPQTAPARFREKPRFAVPDTLEFFGDRQSQMAFVKTLGRIQQQGVELVSIDFSAFNQLAEQLYNGAWVAERTVAIGDIFKNQPEAMDPTVRGIVANGLNYTACDAWQAEYTRAELAQKINDQLREFDALLVPTSPTIHTLAEMAQHPVRYNSQFGTYTNFTNLADLCALALPGDFRNDGLPAGITLIAPAWHDQALSHFGKSWQQALNIQLGATGKTLSASNTAKASTNHVRVAVVGAHLREMPLNHQLTSRNAVFIEETRTAAHYRLYALANTQPPKPGLVRHAEGLPIAVELWDIPLARFGEFVAEIPAPLGIGTLVLENGESVKGFICEPEALLDATDITAWGGWKAWLARHHSA
ncbi:allophanate hydrolase [Buttiauxella sp. WJP83]|uniref:allophanate hydrolase n=1 Tax=Buttiauxella sp. WJP83 TaxID=2986951 RepID=UPI0022DE0B68|nr:allophanate hydrolase [Buttiauxella sp. WJP83]WBM68747.1 allophanate hydrolase [Buttiauxella sp. WJP83]